MDLRTGPSITLYGEDAALLEPYLRNFERMSQARGNGDEEAGLRVFAIRRLAGQWLGSANGSSELPTLDQAPPPLHDEFHTTDHVAKVLGIGDRRVRQAIKAGRLKDCRKVGGTWQIPVASVIAELERRQEQKGA